MANRVALIGAGVMGSAIGTRLLETGNELHAFDLDKQKLAALAAKGAKPAQSAAAAAASADFVITSLNSAKIVGAAISGQRGSLRGLRLGR